MNLSTIQEQVEAAVEKGHFATAFNLLKKNIQHKSSSREQLIGISATYSNLIADRNMNLIKDEMFRVERSRVSASLLSFNSNIQPDDIGNKVNRDAVENKILTLSVDVTAEQDLLLHLNPEFFPNATPATPSNVPTQDQQQDIIIFNAMHITEEVRHNKMQGSQKSWFDHLEKLVKTTDHLILYYGPNYDKINEWRYRVATANSPFTLYARLKEIADFITIYRR